MRKHENQSKPIYYTIWWRNSAVIEQYSESHWTWRRLGVFHLCFREFFRAWTCFWRLSKVCSFYIVYNLKSRSTDLLTMESVYIYFTCFRGLLGFGQNPKWFSVVMISFSCIQHMWRTISCVVKLSKLFFSQLHLFFHLIKKTSSSASFERTSFSSPLKMFCSDLLIKFQQLQSDHLIIYPLLNSICAFCYLLQSMRKKIIIRVFFFKLLSIYEIDATL